MATVAAVAGVVGAVAGVASAVQQRSQARQIAAEQRRQNQIRNRLARAQRAREVRQRVAQTRVRRAELIQAGVGLGVPGSTSVQQATGALGASLAGTIGASQQQLGVAELIAQSQNRISGIQSQFNPFAAIGGLAGAFTDPQANVALGGLFGIGGGGGGGQ